MKTEICTRSLLRNKHTYLLVRHSSDWKWVLPGGHIEKNDITILDSIDREIEEEFWIKWVQWISPIEPHLEDDTIQLLPCPFTSYEVNYVDKKWRNRKKIEYIFYWFIKDDIKIIPQIEEIFEYRWIPYSEIITKEFSTFISVKDIIQALHAYVEKL